MKTCTFLCEHSDSSRAQHAACMAVNGVYCTILKEVIEKGRRCPVEPPPPEPRDPEQPPG